MSRFSEIFNDLLIEHNTNAKRISKELNIQDSTTYKYLHGTLPRVEKAVLLANYFDCSLNYLMGIDEYPKEIKFNKTFDKKVFYPRYEKLLKENNSTHYLLCKSLGLSMSSLLSWKQGTIPYLDTLYNLAQHFDVSIDYLIGRSDSK